MLTIFHKAIGFPTAHPRPQVGLVLTYSRHSIEKALNREDLQLQILPLTLPDYDLVEIYFDGHQLAKYVVRMPLLRHWDLVMVINPDGFVRTLWLNSKVDQHQSLIRSRYSDPLTFTVQEDDHADNFTQDPSAHTAPING